MPDTLPLRCRCGQVRGALLDAERVFRIVCHCQGCQAYARWLDREGEILNEHGGTDVYQLTPSQLRIDEGRDLLRAVRLTDKGAIRWFTDCCRTPVGNRLEQAWVPWMGMPHLFIDGDALGDTRDASGAEVRFRINGRYAIGQPEGVHRSGPPALVFGSMARTFVDLAHGRQKPSAFHDPATGEPLVQPILATSADRIALGLEQPPVEPPVPRRRLLGCG